MVRPFRWSFYSYSTLCCDHTRTETHTGQEEWITTKYGFVHHLLFYGESQCSIVWSKEDKRNDHDDPFIPHEEAYKSCEMDRNKKWNVKLGNTRRLWCGVWFRGCERWMRNQVFIFVHNIHMNIFFIVWLFYSSSFYEIVLGKIFKQQIPLDHASQITKPDKPSQTHTHTILKYILDKIV